MSKVFSWKLKNGQYGYVVKANGSYIGDRLGSKDSILIKEMINTINKYTEYQYRYAFSGLNEEIRSNTSLYGPEIVWDDAFYSEDNNTDLIIFENGGGGTSGSGGYTPEQKEEYQRLIDKINEELKKAEEKIKAENEVVMAKLLADVNKTIKESEERIEIAQEIIQDVNADLATKLSAATNVISAATVLFQLDESQITSEQILAALSASSYVSNWLDENKNAIKTVLVDYNAASGIIGTIATSQSVLQGALSTFATSVSVMSGTVGTVQVDLNASKGQINQMASWINTYSGTVSELAIKMDAINSTIIETAKFISGDSANQITNAVQREINGAAGAIIDTAISKTSSGISVVAQELNSLSSVVKTTIDRVDAGGSQLTTLGDKMDALNATSERWITKTNHLSGITVDLRDAWSEQSGMLRSVSTLVANTDEKGNIIYLYTKSNGETVRVYPRYTYDSEGKMHVDYFTSPEFIGDPVPSDRVSPDYSNTMTSYIHQTSSSVTISVLNSSSAIGASIKTYIENNSGFIQMVADKVIVDADMIAKSLSAKTANIGGIIIGNGEITSLSTGDNYFRLNGKTGGITANNLTLRSGKSIETELNNATSSANSYTDGKTNGILIDAIASANAYTDSKVIEASSGGTQLRHVTSSITIGDQTYNIDIVEQYIYPTSSTPSAWTELTRTYKVGNEPYIYTNVGLGNEGNTFFKVSTKGLLQADNAVIHGAVYATSGYFGNIYIDKEKIKVGSGNSNSYFDRYGVLHCSGANIQGDITANSLTLKNKNTIEQELTNATNNAITGANSYTDEKTSGILKDAIDSAKTYTDDRIKSVSGSGTEIKHEIGTQKIGEISYNYDRIQIKSGNNWTTIAETYRATGGSPYLYTSVGSRQGTFFEVSDKGLLEANNAIINGTILASSGRIGGVYIYDGGLSGDGFTLTRTGLTSTNFSISDGGDKVVLNGSTRHPFMKIQISGSTSATSWNDKYDNYYADFGGSSSKYKNPYYSIPLIWDETQIGRKLTIVSNKSGTTGKLDQNYIEAKEGFYFYEDGIKKSHLFFGNEIIELLGYGISSGNTSSLNGKFFGFIVKRDNILTPNCYGHNLKALAMGTIIKSGSDVTNLVTCDGTKFLSGSTWSTGATSSFFRCKNIGVGKYLLGWPPNWFGYNTNVSFSLTSRTPKVTASVSDVANSGMTIECYTNTTNKDCDVEFILYNKEDWRNLGSSVDPTLKVTPASFIFDGNCYGLSYASAVTVSNFGPEVAKDEIIKSVSAYTDNVKKGGSTISEDFISFSADTTGTFGKIIYHIWNTKYGGYELEGSYTCDFNIKYSYHGITKIDKVKITLRDNRMH